MTIETHEILYGHLTREQMHAYCLVLDAYHLPYLADATSEGGRIRVNNEICPLARDLVEKYIQENPEPDETGEPEFYVKQKSTSAFWVCLVLLAAYIIVRNSGDPDLIVRVYGASAFPILKGEVYRAATALMIHADWTHLAGNLAGMALLGTMVVQITGAGVGWLMILSSGILGNLANALFFQHSHLSIGASTAIFGALGFLSAYQAHLKWQSPRPDQRRKAWLPLAGGLALLGFMGTASRSDLMAHLFGMLAGLGLGAVYALVLRSHIRDRHQIWAMAVVIAMVALSWLRPFHGAG